MSKERHQLRVIKGGFQPAYEYDKDRLKEKGYRVGDIVFAELVKPRNPAFHRLVHQFGTLISENIEAFEDVPSHDVIKRIQLEADIECKSIRLIMPGVGPVDYRVPKSISFESMDNGSFESMFKRMCRYIIKKYWPNMTDGQILEMSQLID